MRKSVISSIMIALMLTFGLSGTAAADNQGASGNSELHWAQAALEDLDQRYAVKDALGDFDLDQEIPALEMEKLLKAVFQEEINFSTSQRQEVVSRLIDLKAARNGINLNELLFIALVPFDDFQEISPEYTRNIMYAYSTGLIKGSCKDHFEPLRNISYGEAIVMTKRLVDAIQDGAFYVKADVVRQENTITFNFSLVNNTDQNQTLTFPTAQLFDVVVSDTNGTEVYRYSENQLFAQTLTDRTIPPGESISTGLTWNLTDKQGQQVTPGRYTVELSFVPEGSPISAVISFEY